MMYRGKAIRVGRLDEGMVELCFDRQGESVNKLDVTTVEELKAATDLIRQAGDVRGILVTSALDSFIVGADIFEFTALFAKPAEVIEAHIAWENSIFTAFEDLDIPSVATLAGLALGGGLEMALTCDARVMSEATRIGVPEVSLGLFPGFGGTVRLPRIAGPAAAIEWIMTGKPQSAQTALATAAVDQVVAPDAVRPTAIAILKSLIQSGDWRAARRRRQGPFTASPEVFAKAKASLAKSSVHQPAALAAVELMERASASSRDEALRLEHAAFAQIARTQAAGSLIQLFINEQQIKKKARQYAKIARKVQRSGVVGAGIMGGGIAYTSAVRGIPTLLKDIQQTALDIGMAEAGKLLAKQVESGRLESAKAASVLADIKPMLEYADFGSVDVVVEAVVENINVKKAVLRDIEKLVRPDTIIASNTSSLSISEMATALERPGNFVGMHFFNPVPLMPLVEVIRGGKTSPEAAATVAAYAGALGKTAIVVEECPGFLVNRILIPYMLGFLRAIHSGADYLRIDGVMEAFGWPMGPAYLQDVIGMDTLQHVLEVIAGGFAARMRVDFPQAVQMWVSHGRLGQKSGAGFYRYETDPKGRPRKQIDPQTEPLLAAIQPGGRAAFSDQELHERLMLPLIIEAARCLEEGIAATPAEIDMSLVLGLGFPKHAGGPLKYADWLGMKHVVARCDAYAAVGPLYTPTEAMRSAAQKGATYYAV